MEVEARFEALIGRSHGEVAKEALPLDTEAYARLARRAEEEEAYQLGTLAVLIAGAALGRGMGS
jgi:hypothetical protein